MNSFVQEVISEKVDLVATDDAGGQHDLHRLGYKHGAVGRMRHQYVVGAVHTSNIDNFGSLLKRGIMGTYHNVSRKYLPLYLNEFVYRHNNRSNPDIFGTAIAEC